MLMDFLCLMQIGEGCSWVTWGGLWFLLVWSWDSTCSVQLSIPDCPFCWGLTWAINMQVCYPHFLQPWRVSPSLKLSGEVFIRQGSNIKEGKEHLIIGFSLTTLTAAFKSNSHALAIDMVYFSGKFCLNSNFYHILHIFLKEFYT